MTEANPKKQSTRGQTRKRARKPDGRFKGDNPATPDLNEAWEPTPVEQALPKENAYEVKPKVDGLSNPTAGKYAKKDKVRPTFGQVTTTFN